MRRKIKHDDLQLDRVSTPHVFGGSHSDGLYPHMFIEDIRLTAFPYRRGAAATLSTVDANVEELVCGAFSFGRRGYGREEFSEVFFEWARDCASMLAQAGRAVFEIANWRRENGTIVGFAVIPIFPDYIRRCWGAYVQRAPTSPGDFSDSSPPSKSARAVRISAERIVEVKLPRRYAGTLKLTGDSAGGLSSFMLPNHKDRRSVPFDFDLWKRTQNLAIAESTRATGWNARGTFNEIQSEYYSVWRELRFEQFKLLIRERVLSAANRILANAARVIGSVITVSLSDLPDEKDIAWADGELAIGDTAASDIYDRFRR